jgi:hypothetical protein
MNILKYKMAEVLTDAAKKGLKLLDKGSPCAKALKRIDFDKALKEDIGRICDKTSFIEASRLLSLYSRLHMTKGDEDETLKNDLKRVAEDLVERVEKESGRLNIPKQCRQLLLNL